MALKIGFIINPLAGIGGAAGLKGSDAAATQKAGDAGSLQLKAQDRAEQFLLSLKDIIPNTDWQSIRWLTIPRQMGQTVLQAAAVNIECVNYDTPKSTRAENTQQAVSLLCERDVDLLVFVGGDGTARDVCSVVTQVCPQQPVLGVPSGVKMHSGVFAINPKSAAKVVAEIVTAQLVEFDEHEVRDIDESLLAQGTVKSRYYGDMWVPSESQLIQNVKQGGGESDELSLLDIAADIQLRVDDLNNPMLIFAPGSTTQCIQQEMGSEATLLGVDIVVDNSLLAADVNSETLLSHIQNHQGDVRIVLTAIGGQGHLIGRGNQQLSPQVLKTVGKENLWVVITDRKLAELNQRPLILDSNDTAIDSQWSGLIPVISGYQKQVLYPLSS